VLVSYPYDYERPGAGASRPSRIPNCHNLAVVRAIASGWYSSPQDRSNQGNIEESRFLLGD